MFRDRKKLPAFHEDDFTEILAKFNLLDKLNEGELKCSVCDKILTKENFGCIYLTKNEEIKTSCSDLMCLEKVYQETKNGSE